MKNKAMILFGIAYVLTGLCLLLAASHDTGSSGLESTVASITDSYEKIAAAAFRQGVAIGSLQELAHPGETAAQIRARAIAEVKDRPSPESWTKHLP
jgi:hypothetical protein